MFFPKIKAILSFLLKARCRLNQVFPLVNSGGIPFIEACKYDSWAEWMINAINVWILGAMCLCCTWLLPLFISKNIYIMTYQSTRFVSRQNTLSEVCCDLQYIQGWLCFLVSTTCGAYFSPLWNHGKYFLNVNCWRTNVLWNFSVTGKIIQASSILLLFKCAMSRNESINLYCAICTGKKGLTLLQLSFIFHLLLLFFQRRNGFIQHTKGINSQKHLVGLQKFLNPHYRLKLINIHKKTTIEWKHKQ